LPSYIQILAAPLNLSWEYISELHGASVTCYVGSEIGGITQRYLQVATRHRWTCFAL